MIRAARLERNMTAQELTEKTGVSRPLLSNVKKGDQGVSLGRHSKLPLSLKCSCSWRTTSA
ncbi:hypothetical protein LCGC14_0479980 [marine sediment metagenome]|uniref:HTH cro/C1-type domain-containing protein n=1 Tax=marine sediment metagenome TaxID=412755 RepID=A0A0F9UWL9_9ZZZZ